MSDETTDVESDESRGLSRRGALKAGVAAGVGAVAWSGVSITSLGGTPAYALNCTGAGPPIPLLDCRNTDQGNCTSVRYHTLRSVPPPYSVTNNIVENSGICCSDFGAGGTPPPHFLFPNTQKCTVFVEFYVGGDTSCENRNLANRTGFVKYGPSQSGDIELFTPDPCPQFSTSGTKMTIFAICTDASFPDECFNQV